MDRMDTDDQEGVEASLTWRELEIIALLREHLSNSEIASRLHLSLHSVKWYSRQIFGKLGVSNRREAVIRAHTLGLFRQNQLEAEPIPSGNLPVPINLLISRSEELTYLQHAICDRGIRFITLTGVGGIGKTRLAIEAARQATEHFPHGVWFVDLASLVQPGHIAQTVLAGLGVSASPGHEYRQGHLQKLNEYLKSKKLLLVLDNCEHLLESCAQLTHHLLNACPKLVILITSREAMGIMGEVIFQVPPLAISDPPAEPDQVVLPRSAAVQLFCQRAEAVRNDFSLTAEDLPIAARICQQVDGIPLAIELAAARASMLSLAQIAEGLEDCFLFLTGGSRTDLARHRTLRASIDWSYSLLNDTEQRLFQDLSVFSGGWSTAAAEALWAFQKPDKFEVLDVLTSLANKSLVQVDHHTSSEPRYHLLETIRQYAREKLAQEQPAKSSDEVTVRDRHLAYYLDFAEGIIAELRTARRLVSLSRLETELDNFRIALLWSLEIAPKGRAEKGLRLAVALVDLWKRDGLYQEGREWVQKGLDLVDWNDADDIVFHARALSAAGTLSMGYSDYRPAHRFYEQSINLFRMVDDPLRLAETLILLAEAYGWESPLPEADLIAKRRGFSEEAFTLAHRSGDRWVQAFVLYWSAFNAERDGIADIDISDANYSQAIALFQQTGDRWSAVPSMRTLGVHANLRGDRPAAQRYLSQALELCREEKNAWEMGQVLSNLGDIAYFQSDYQLVERCFLEAQAIFQEIGYKAGVAWSLQHRGVAARRLGNLRQAAGFYLEGLDQFQYEAVGYISEIWLGLAGIAVEQNHLVEAATLIGAVEALDPSLEQQHRGPVIYIPQAELEKDRVKLHQMLDAETFAKCLAEGRSMTVEQALRAARAIPFSLD